MSLLTDLAMSVVSPEPHRHGLTGWPVLRLRSHPGIVRLNRLLIISNFQNVEEKIILFDFDLSDQFVIFEKSFNFNLNT